MTGVARWLFGRQCCACGAVLAVGCAAPFCGDCAPAAERVGRWSHLRLPGADLPVLAGWSYGGAVAAAVQRIKFGGAQPGLEGLVEELGDGLYHRAGGGPLALMPIPPQRQRLRGRGFHLPDRIAEALARGCRSWRVHHLMRRADLNPPRTLRPDLRPGFVAWPDRRGLPIWLVDDVLTTGTTLGLATAALSARGVSVAGAICLCDARFAAQESQRAPEVHRRPPAGALGRGAECGP